MKRPPKVQGDVGESEEAKFWYWFTMVMIFLLLITPVAVTIIYLVVCPIGKYQWS